MELEKVTSMIESILFVSDKPVSLERLRDVLGVEETTEQDLKDALETIKERYEGPAHGYELREGHGGFHFCTKTANAEVIRKFLQTKPFRLGRSALEVLAIIAYRQPVTRAEIDKVRGIDSSHLMRTLIERGLVKMAGKADIPGRPVQYGTTPRFLEVTGLRTLGELPPLSELEQLQGHTDDGMSRMESGLDKFVQASPNRSEMDATGENIEGLAEIDQMIQSVQRADREIYESELHADVARENEDALEGFLNFMKPYRKSRKAAAVSDDEVAEESNESDSAAEAIASFEDAPGEIEAFEDARPEDESLVAVELVEAQDTDSGFAEENTPLEN